MPQPQPRQATCAAGVSVSSSLARNSLARPNSRAWEMRAGMLLRRSSTKGTAAALVLATGPTARSVPCHSRSLAKPRVQPE